MAVKGRKKMNIGNMEDCLGKALHHLGKGGIEGDKTWRMMEFSTLHGGENPEDILRYRHRIIREEIEEAEKRVQRIREVATRQGNAEILAILNERFKFGHDI